MHLECFNDLEADCVHRVHCRHRLLEDHCNFPAANRTNPFGRCLEGVLAREQDLTERAAVDGQQTEKRHGRRGLARAGLTDDGEHLSGSNGIVDVLCGHHPFAVNPEINAEVLSLNDDGFFTHRVTSMTAWRV